MRAHKVDSNHAQIVAALKQVGATVLDLSGVGGGCPDLAVGIFGRNFLLEIKSSEQPVTERDLTPAQSIWHVEWKGQKAIVRNAEEAIAALNKR